MCEAAGSNFLQFLRGRNIQEEIILQLQNEKIDEHVISLMDENSLKKYFPKYGDRLAVKDFCSKTTEGTCKRKLGLLDKFRAKIRAKEEKNVDDPDSPKTVHSETSSTCSFTTASTSSLGSSIPSTSCGKTQRQIHLGWLMINEEGKKIQVREKHGGGIRKPIVSRNAKKSELLELGKNFFFPGGESTHKGKLKNYSFDIVDYQMNPLKDTITVGELYSTTRLSHLRFYFATTLLEDDEKECSLGSTSPVVISDHEYTLEFDDDVILPISNLGNIENPSAGPVGDPTADPETSTINLVVHRGQIFQDLLQAFKNLHVNFSSVTVTVILPNGDKERAVDIGGVFRDCLSEFWNTFFDKCTLGTLYKVPVIRHDFKDDEWQACAKILLKGWELESYFPIELAPAFIEHCIFGESIDLMTSFRNFVSDSAREVIDKCLRDFQNTDKDELFDFLQEYDCKRVADESNISQIINEIAHQEIVQKPMFVINAWKVYMSNMVSKHKLNELYEQLKPTSKNILKIVFGETSNVDEERVFNFLKKYIRESNNSTLKAFLRFCTGSDLVIGRLIQVVFNHSEGLKRNPVGHVCTCSLELPITYDSYPDFRSEFNNVLMSNIWVMDLI